jgi:hypothetical protein
MQQLMTTSYSILSTYFDKLYRILLPTKNNFTLFLSFTFTGSFYKKQPNQQKLIYLNQL